MNISNSREWKSPTIIGLAVLALGSGVMGTQWALSKPAAGVPGWSSFTGTTVGDTLLLPVLAACLFAAFFYLPQARQRTERLILVAGVIVGGAGGLALQLSWLLDDHPRLSWVLPRVHHFSTIGYYHAIFLCAVSGALFSSAFGAAYRVRRMTHAVPADSAYKLGRSPLLFVILVCIWTFSILTIQGGGSGASNVATVASVMLPSLLVILLCAYAFGAHWAVVLPTVLWALILTALLCLIIIKWPASLNDALALLVALGLTSGISFRREGWQYRIPETIIIGAVTVCLIVLPLGDPKASIRNLLLALAVGPVIVLLTSLHPLVDQSFAARCSRRDAVIACVFAISVPAAAWLFTNGGVSNTPIGTGLMALASFLYATLLVPWYSLEMKQVHDSEAAHKGVTVNPELTALARRVAFRGASWGIAAISALLGIVISAGPSMGFNDGAKMPDLRLWLCLLTLLAALGSVTVACLARQSPVAPASVVIGSLIVSGLVLANLAEAHHHLGLFAWVAAATGLVGLWQVESILGNAAMRPRWLVRREWRHVVAASVALAVGLLAFGACDDGMINSAGKPAEALASLLIFLGEILTALMLVVGAGWALDWQPTSVASRHVSGSDTGAAPNWARYRLRGCLLMDFGLIQGLTAIGIWLPALALAHIGLGSRDGILNTVLMVGSVMIFFIPLFTWTLNTSIKHVKEQSRKAHRPSTTLFYGTLPYVSLAEEMEVARSLLTSHEGPVGQKQWAAAIAVHQLHLNLIAIAISLISLVGALGVLVLVISDFAVKDQVAASK